MFPWLLMIAGAVIFLFGVFINMTIVFEPFRKVIEVVYKRNDDYVEYESAKGKKLLEEQKSILSSVGQTATILGVIVFALGFIAHYMPRGNDSLLSENIENGSTTGDEETDLMDLSSNGAGFIAADGKEYSVCISISGSDVFVNNILVKDDAKLEQIIFNIDRRFEVYLIDDFADAHTFHSVEQLLDDNGIKKVIQSE